jgi:hypothetical protein
MNLINKFRCLMHLVSDDRVNFDLLRFEASTSDSNAGRADRVRYLKINVCLYNLVHRRTSPTSDARARAGQRVVEEATKKNRNNFRPGNSTSSS